VLILLLNPEKKIREVLTKLYIAIIDKDFRVKNNRKICLVGLD